jgi:hypothetical protein
MCSNRRNSEMNGLALALSEFIQRGLHDLGRDMQGMVTGYRLTRPGSRRGCGGSSKTDPETIDLTSKLQGRTRGQCHARGWI